MKAIVFHTQPVRLGEGNQVQLQRPSQETITQGFPSLRLASWLFHHSLVLPLKRESESGIVYFVSTKGLEKMNIGGKVKLEH